MTLVECGCGGRPVRKGTRWLGDNVRVVRGVWICRVCDNERSKLRMRAKREALRVIAG